MKSNIFDKISFLSLFLVVVLLPFFFLPFTNIPIETLKGLLLVVGLAVCIIFWAIARFSDGKISFPKSLILVGGAGIILAFFLSALFSEASGISFFGTIFEIGTFWFISAGFLLMLFSSIIFRNLQNAKMLLSGIMFFSIIVLVFQGLRFFMPEILSLGVLGGKTDNILGSWNAFGIFAGFSALTSLLISEFFLVTRKTQWILRILVLFSMVFIAAVNLLFVWEILGIFSLFIFVYKVSVNSNEKDGEEKKIHFPAFSFIIVMITLLFFISGAFIGEILPRHLGLSNTEVSPSLGATMSVTKSVLANDPIFGIGPNRFGVAWAMYKPTSVNNTVFWDVFFNSGSGLLPTLASTTGYLGILAWLIFFILLIVTGMRFLFVGIKRIINREIIVFFLLSLYLFISSFFYSTGSVIFLLAFAFTGVFIGLYTFNSPNGKISISFLDDHRKSFFSILLLVVVMIISVTTAFEYIQRFASVSYFRKTLLASNIPDAQVSIGKAISLYSNDLYMRTYAQIYLIKLNSLIKQGVSLSDADKATLQANLDQAVNGAQLAVTYDPKNYLNFQAIGSVYQTVASFGVPGAYSKAIEAHEIASSLNPNNPSIKLSIANAFFADGKIKEAKEYAKMSLSLKPDYIDALITLSQIVKSEGDNASALSYAERALAISPTNQDLIQYMESLKNLNGATKKDEDSEKKTP